jgi:hypothetical protein
MRAVNSRQARSEHRSWLPSRLTVSLITTAPDPLAASTHAPLPMLRLDFRQFRTSSRRSVFDMPPSVSKMIEMTEYHPQNEIYVHATCRGLACKVIVD